jgi:hypothetical protein
MTFQPESSFDESDVVLPRKRRARSQLPFMGSEERDAALDALAQRAFPSVRFFAGTVAAALFLAVAMWLQSPPLMMASVLVAPSLAPLAGTGLGFATSSPRFAARNLIALLIGIALACGTAIAVREVVGATNSDRIFQIALDVPTFAVVIVSSVVLTFCIIRSPEAVRIASAGIWFVLLSGMTVAMWNLVDGHGEASAMALAMVGCYLLTGIFICSATFLLLGFRPPERNILAFGGILLLVGMMAVAAILWMNSGEPLAMAVVPSATPTPRPTLTQAPIPSATSSPTPEPTATETITPTPTASQTPTFPPVPAIIRGTGGRGANLRESPLPDGKPLRSLTDGQVVEVLSAPVLGQGVEWLQVRTTDGAVGWIAMELCATVTPAAAH